MFGTVVKKGGFENPGYMHGISCISIEKRCLVEENMMAKEKTEEKSKFNTCSSSSTSSIGKNSDVSGNSLGNSEDTEEVQSSYKSPLDAMEALEEVLPIRKGISGFINGKSKSFASLSDATSAKELLKPENAYAKRRRNLVACSLFHDRNKNFSLKNNGGGISKRVTNSSRTTLALAVSMSSSSHSLNSDSDKISRFSRFPPLQPLRHPRVSELQAGSSTLPRRDFCPLKCFSLADLQDSDSATDNTAPSSRIERKQS